MADTFHLTRARNGYLRLTLSSSPRPSDRKAKNPAQGLHLVVLTVSDTRLRSPCAEMASGTASSKTWRGLR